MNLRPYQAEAVDATLAAFETHQSALVVMPTGTGKTCVAAEIMNRMPGRKMAIAHRIELLDQAKEHIERVTGFGCDTERGQEYSREGELYGKARIVVATVQTLNSGRNQYRFERFDPMEFGLLWIDEFHHGTADSYCRVMEHFKKNPECKILGVTATPDRADETALGLVAETVSYVLEIQDAIGDGWLVPITARPIFIESIDLSGVRTTAGDLNGADLEAQIDKNAVAIGNQLYPVAMGRKTLVFAPAVLSSLHIAEALNHEAALAGNPPCALHVDGKTPEDERAKIFDDFANNPDIDFLCNVGIATEGWDGPFVECIAIARPTKSRAMYCLDEETEILTPHGWKRHCDHFETAYQYHPANKSVSVSGVIARTSRELLGDESMWGINGRHLSVSVTNNHRVVGFVRRGHKKEIVSDERIASRGVPDWYKIPVAGDEPARGIPLTADEIRFIGLAMTDGTVGKTHQQVTISQSERYPDCIEYIRRVCNGCGFKFTESVGREAEETNFGIRQHKIHKFTVSFGKPRGTQKHRRGWGELFPWYSKSLSPLFNDATRGQLLILLEAMNVGDGKKYRSPSIYWKPKTMCICTARRDTADNVQSLCVRRGVRCSIGNNGSGVFLLNINTSQSAVFVSGGRSDGRKTWGPMPRAGRVWCIQVESGAIICRRNGKPFITGNSQMVGRGTRPLPGVVDGPPTAEERRAAIAASAKPSMEIIDFVGNAGRHKLVYATDILGGNYDREVVDEAEKAIRENTGKPLDVTEELERAKRRLEQQKVAAAEAARRRIIQSGARVVATVGNAVNVFDLLDVRPPWSANDVYEMPASPAQTDLLIKFGLPSNDVYKMSKRTASRMIGKLMDRRKKGLCTFKQARLLQKNGHSPDATFEEARRIIDELSKGWRSRPR